MFMNLAAYQIRIVAQLVNGVGRAAWSIARVQGEDIYAKYGRDVGRERRNKRGAPYE